MQGYNLGGGKKVLPSVSAQCSSVYITLHRSFFPLLYIDVYSELYIIQCSTKHGKSAFLKFMRLNVWNSFLKVVISTGIPPNK